jgi:hypothetical protein
MTIEASKMQTNTRVQSREQSRSDRRRRRRSAHSSPPTAAAATANNIDIRHWMQRKGARGERRRLVTNDERKRTSVETTTIAEYVLHKLQNVKDLCTQQQQQQTGGQTLVTYFMLTKSRSARRPRAPRTPRRPPPPPADCDCDFVRT